jgi:putative pyruvate formate lyase activating enzyme
MTSDATAPRTAQTGPLPSYVTLHRTGELDRRAHKLVERLASCDVCPRRCGVDREHGGLGYCMSPRQPVIASACAHRGEEPPVSGSRGSGTIFFANCNLRCVFCQNHQISQDPGAFVSRASSAEDLARTMLRLQDGEHCHNINLVSPSHFVPQIVEALCIAVPIGFRLPLVYNTNAYDSVETLRLLDGVVDVYLPDLKYASAQVAGRLSGARDYVPIARAAIAEMHRQIGGALVLDGEGVVARGLIVRHLVLPGGLAGSADSLRWLAGKVGNDITLSLMSQYYPAHRAHEFSVLSRRVQPKEYDAVVARAQALGFEHIWAQEAEASSHYRPDFERGGHPFE